ncbi:MAG: DUF2188 domain-containing protein [Persicimonas sp.]
MRWRTNQIPQSLQEADPEVRGRALSIAERMVREGEEKARALFEGLERAQNMGEAEASVARIPAEREFFVVPSEQGWELRSEDQTEPSREFGSRDEALSHGHDKARKVQGNLYIHNADGRLEEIVNFFEEESIRLGGAGGNAESGG